ncbi:MAG: FAD-dependent oxidoreductase [Oscillospiraceae bacterium]|nr:FAD-dependent oxidoreductase [Oscillospiraceae bacterium]
MEQYDVIVIGGGPAGLAAAISAHENGAKTLLIEREARLGGMLKQCIHDGFGLSRFGERLAGPEYVERFIDRFRALGIEAQTRTFVTRVERHEASFTVVTVNQDGLTRYGTKTLILATGCRERTAKQVSIHGTRPAGVFTAGTAQHFTNLLGVLPTKKCVILGSGDIGLIMARRLTLEGAQVLGVYEAKPTPSGLTRNIHQCLHDYDIPLHLSHTVTRVFGQDRLTGVEIAEVDNAMKPIPGTEQRLECDALIVSVGLIPENELAESLHVPLDPRTNGPVCDGQLMTEVPGVFSCGNALHVNDLVDYVSASGEEAGRNAAHYAQRTRDEIVLGASENFQYLVPQRLDRGVDNSAVTVYFRSRDVLGRCRVTLTVDGRAVWSKQYPFLRPPEMQQLTLDFGSFGIADAASAQFEIEVEA